MVIWGKQEPRGVLPGQVRQQGCLCCLSIDLPLQGGHTKPAEALVVGTIPKKLEDRGKCLGVMNLCEKPLAVINLCQSYCLDSSRSRPFGLLQFTESQNHGMMEYPKLEEIHMGSSNPSLDSDQSNPRCHTSFVSIAVSGFGWGKQQLPEGQDWLCPPTSSLSRPILFHIMRADLCLYTACACGNVPLHTWWRDRSHVYPYPTAVGT